MNDDSERLHETPPMSSSTSLHGKRLLVARAPIISTTALVSGLFGFALPGSSITLATPCADALNQCLMTPEQVKSLANLGVSPHTVAFLAVALSCLVVLLVYGVATVLIWRRSDDWMALLVALVCTLMPVNFAPVLATLRAAHCVAAAGSGALRGQHSQSPPARHDLPQWALRAPLAMAALAVDARLLQSTWRSTWRAFRPRA